MQLRRLWTISFILLTGAVLIHATSGSTVQSLYLFPNGTAAENLIVRSDGSILMSMIYPSAELYYFPNSTTRPTLLQNFSGSTAAYGIVEYEPDTIAIITGTFSRAGDITNTTGTIWRVDLTDDSTSVLSELHEVGFLNGATLLNDSHILVADSVKGVVYNVETQTGQYETVLNDIMLPPNTTGPVRLGVNGLKMVNQTLFFTNTNKRLVGKVDLNDDGTASGPYSIVASNVLVDDLDIDPSTGAVFIASLVANSITYVAPNGSISVIAGSLNSTDVPGPTAVRLVKDSKCRDTRLLISTSGGIEYPINGSYIQGGGLYELIVPDL